MKIGVITQPLGHNYGGILQNYALQTVLKRLGHDPITIRVGKPSKLRWFLSCNKTLLYCFMGKKRIFPESPFSKNRRYKGLHRFVENKIALTKHQSWYTPAIVSKYKLDGIVVGSDQVWRPCYNRKIEDLFLQFAVDTSIQRVAYAASFGTADWEFTDVQTQNCKQLVKAFEAVSVREKDGVALCEKYLDLEAKHVLDPTLLLDKEDYEELCKAIEPTTQPFLFAYVLDQSSKKKAIIQEIAKMKNLDVRYIFADENMKSTDSIEQWLSSFRDAEYIVTDSFHGTVFSILFQTPFTVLLNHKRGNSRFDSLLSSFGLEDRIYKEVINDVPIDWIKINSQLELLRNESINYLKSSLCQKYL